MEICLKNKCTGCYACVNACSHHCIQMREDEDGAVRPVIDESKCVGCKLCVSSCPNNVELEFRTPIKCYASWITDTEKRRICASGGIGTIMSEYVLKQRGVVFGSRYDNNLTPIMTYVENLEDLESFKGSRYVQSLVGNTTYKEVRTFLRTGRLVLFVGTPCQIAGLKTFLRKEYENLITVDLICHGTSPTKYLKDEVDYLSEKFHLQGVSDIRFRGNDGNNYRLTLWNKDRRKLFPRNNYREKLLRFDEAQQFYLQGFLLGVSLRENCYTCNYARPERISDITIGDFIGLGQEKPFLEHVHNVSSVMINTRKGQTFYDSVCDNSESLKNEERNYSERLLYKPSLVYPFPRHDKNEEFTIKYKEKGFPEAIRIVLKNELRKKQMEPLLGLIRRIYHIPGKIFENKCK